MPTTRSREALTIDTDPWVLAQRKLEEVRDTISRLAVANADRSLALVGDAVGELAERVARAV